MTGETLHEPATRAPLYHGGRLARARLAFPGAPEPFLDLSTGINPRAYPIPPLAPEIFSRLPEPESLLALEHAAAAAYGAADPTMAVAAPGTQALIALLPRLRAPCRVAVVAPTYAEHAEAWRSAGHNVTNISDPRSLRTADVLVVCNPNNPDGRIFDRDALGTIAEKLEPRDGWLVVDEAFADFEPASLSAIPLRPRRNIIVLRSFGKTYGLAGLRLGFAVTHAALAGNIRSALGPWPVSGPAIEIGRSALRDNDWLHAARRRLARDVEKLDAVLAHAGLRVRGGTLLFRLAETDAAEEKFGHLGRAGILVRRFPEHPTWLRFGIPADDATFERLAAALDFSSSVRN
jgi:cobalamin biosynthetic protein CobC